ncbi:hypothetical protein PENSPDRAFT_683349 [Peniophora sp. CONT]|nr:hypothetical protein PENSPDRAFT_683349 [Peniophora sp. CONT]
MQEASMSFADLHWNKYAKECLVPKGPWDQCNAALMRNCKVSPISASTFYYLGGEIWSRVMPNDPRPLCFGGPLTFEQEFEEKEREARRSVAAPPPDLATEAEDIDSEEEDEEMHATHDLTIDSSVSSDASPSSANSVLPRLSTDITSSEEDRPTYRMRLEVLDLCKRVANQKRDRELDGSDDESSSSASNGFKRQRLSAPAPMARPATRTRTNTSIPSFAIAHYRSTKAHYGFLTNSSGSKSRAMSSPSLTSATQPSSSKGSLKRRRDEIGEAEACSSSESLRSGSGKRPRIEAPTRAIMSVAQRPTVTSSDKVYNWLARGTLAPPVSEVTEIDSDSSDESHESGYDVDEESMDDEVDDEAPGLSSMTGRSVADRFQARKKVHYAGSDAAEDDEPIPFWKQAEVLRYAVPNPDGRV